MDGNHAEAYVGAAHASSSRRQQAVLAGIVHKVLAPAGFQRMQTMGGVLSNSAATT